MTTAEQLLLPFPTLPRAVWLPLPDELAAAIKDRATREGRTPTVVVRRVISAALAEGVQVPEDANVPSPKGFSRRLTVEGLPTRVMGQLVDLAEQEDRTVPALTYRLLAWKLLPCSPLREVA